MSESGELIVGQDFRALATVPALHRASALVSPTNVVVQGALISLNARMAAVGQEIFFRPRMDGESGPLTVKPPAAEKPWWPQTSDRFLQLTGRTAWGNSPEEVQAAIADLPLGSSCVSLEDQYRTPERMEEVMPSVFTEEAAVQFGERLAELLAFFVLTATKKQSEHLDALELQFFLEHENTIPDVVFQILEQRVQILRVSITTKLQAMRTLMELPPGVDVSSVMGSIWNGVLDAGRQFATENFATLQRIAAIARTQESLKESVRILDTLRMLKR